MGVYVREESPGASELAVTITLACSRVPGRRWPYIVAQISGAFLAAAVVLNYLPAFHKVDPQLNTPLACSPRSRPSHQPMAGLLDQTIGTALLLR
jgi:glycerol uptake facilitator-like aquaporin